MIPRTYGGETAREYEAAIATAAMSGGGWAGMPVAARAMAGGGWEYAYRPAYWTTYTSVASGTVLAARTAADKLDESTDPAGQLRTALDALGRGRSEASRACAAVQGSSVGGSVDAEVAAGPQSSDQEEARLRGAVDGALDGAREIVTGRRASTPLRDRMAVLGNGTVNDWVHSTLTLATINRGVVRLWLAGEDPAPAAIARLGFVQVPPQPSNAWLRPPVQLTWRAAAASLGGRVREADGSASDPQRPARLGAAGVMRVWGSGYGG